MSLSAADPMALDSFSMKNVWNAADVIMRTCRPLQSASLQSTYGGRLVVGEAIFHVYVTATV